MDSSEILIEIAKEAAPFVVAWATRYADRNNRQLRDARRHEFERNLSAALAWHLSHLSAQVDDLHARVSEYRNDEQFLRIWDNFGYEAAREAIDERCRMLEHAAAGIVDPSIPLERKARIERTLRQLDPADVLTLHGLRLLPGTFESGAPRAKLLFSVPSGVVLVSCGCVRVSTGGGGAGQGVFEMADLTGLGIDVLRALRSYLATRTPPFAIPGREYAAGDRSETEAHELLKRSFSEVCELVTLTVRLSAAGERHYKRPATAGGDASLVIFLHRWKERQPLLEQLAKATAGTDIRASLTPQPYTSSEGPAYDVLKIECVGPHDLLRHLADEADALWL